MVEVHHGYDSFAAGDLCSSAGLTPEQLQELESFGLIVGKGTGNATMYTADDLAIAQAAAGFMKHGVEGRHLRAWRQAAEREASLFEQMILPLLRQRNPQARQQAVTTLTDLSTLGGELRSAIVRSALSHHLDG
jgi:DNA-binding transcriptional MerR regulator